MSSGPSLPRRHAAGAATSALSALVLVVALAGCGYLRQTVPDLSVAVAPSTWKAVQIRRADVKLRVPDNWVTGGAKAPLVTVISSGPAIIALWRYPVGGAATGTSAAAQRDALLAAIKRRDPSFTLIASALTHSGAYPAVEIDAFETINGHRRRVRSEHIYTPAAEVVLDEYAPVASFSRIDHQVFSPVRKSLVVSG